MTQAEKDRIIKDLREKLAEAEKIEVDKPSHWKPEYDEIYWHVYDGAIYQTHWHDDIYDNWRYLIGNCFETRKETETCKKKIEYTAIYKNYVEKHSEPLDWKNRNQQKYNAYYNTNNEEICVESSAYACCQGTIYASSEEIIWDAINSIREDNFKRYVLGVE